VPSLPYPFLTIFFVSIQAVEEDQRLLQSNISTSVVELDSGNMADEVAADRTPGFKVGEKKTLDEYHKLGKLRFGFCIYI
jgi:hypothetical protein